MKQDVVFLCQFFYPETVSSATLPFDTAAHLASKGFRVGALCGYPKEYSAAANVPLCETQDGVFIQRLKYLQLSRKSSIGRLVNYFSFTLKALLNVRKLKEARSVVVYSNPPVLPIAALRAKKKYGTKLIFVAYDVYPEIAYASQAITPGNFLDKVMHYINRRLYAQADMVVALTEEMREYLLAHRTELSPDRVTTIENWAHEKESAPLEEETCRKFGFSADQFIVGYFGNMGTCQDVETVLRTAALLKDDARVGFLMVGHGNKKEAVRSFIAEQGLENVRVFDYLTGAEFTQAVALADCSVVSLEPGLCGTCAPSKYYSCLLGGHPVVAITEPASYLAQEVTEKQVGIHIDNGDAEGFRDAIGIMCDHPKALQLMSRNAKELYHERYDYAVAMEKYETMLQKVL